jgi:Flp pilus assembly protein TadG
MKRASQFVSADRQRGLAAVEFALVLPLLLVVLLATAELGRMLSQYDTLNKSVRDGARYLASVALQAGVMTVTAAEQTATQNLVVTGNVNGSGTALLPGLVAGNVTVSGSASGYVTVTASYTYQPMVAASLPMFGLRAPVAVNIPLNATVVMRAL